MTPPVITAFYASLCALIFIWLTMNVVRNRGRARVSLGDGGDDGLNRAIRGQGNAAEQIPITLIMLGLAEMLGAPALALHLIGALFLVGRLSHSLYFTRGFGMAYRTYGMMMSALATGLLAIGLLVHSLAQML